MNSESNSDCLKEKYLLLSPSENWLEKELCVRADYIGHGERELEIEMAKMFSNHLFAALMLAVIVFSDVKSLPTSVLVDSKQQGDASTGANNKGKSSALTNCRQFRFCVVANRRS